MKLEEQVVSLDWARKLKELGVKQESLFYWREDKDFTDAYDAPFTDPELRISQHGASTKAILELPKPKDSQYTRNYAAFTVAELGEMLPCWGQQYESEESIYWKMPWKVECASGMKWYSEAYQGGHKTEADARAKMLIHLIEKGIVNPEKGGA